MNNCAGDIVAAFSSVSTWFRVPLQWAKEKGSLGIYEKSLSPVFSPDLSLLSEASSQDWKAVP